MKVAATRHRQGNCSNAIKRGVKSEISGDFREVIALSGVYPYDIIIAVVDATIADPSDLPHWNSL